MARCRTSDHPQPTEEDDVSPGQHQEASAGSLDTRTPGDAVVLTVADLDGPAVSLLAPDDLVLVVPAGLGGAPPSAAATRQAPTWTDGAPVLEADVTRDAYVVRPGARSRSWRRACGVEAAATIRPSDPLGCLLAADGVLLDAAALAAARDSSLAGPTEQAWASPVSLAYALDELGFRARLSSAGPEPRTDVDDDPRDAAPVIDPASLSATARQVPVLRGLREVSGRLWRSPVIRVELVPLARHTRDDIVGVTDRWLAGSVDDVAVVIPDVLPEYAGDPRVEVSEDPKPPAPYTLEWPVSLLPGLRTAAGLLDIALGRGCGLVRVRTPGSDDTPSLRRQSVAARLARDGVVAPGIGDVEREAGTWWADGVHLGVTATADRPPGPVHWPRLDVEGWRRIRQLEGQVARLTAAAEPDGDDGTRRRRRRRWRPRGG